MLSCINCYRYRSRIHKMAYFRTILYLYQLYIRSLNQVICTTGGQCHLPEGGLVLVFKTTFRFSHSGKPKLYIYIVRLSCIYLGLMLREKGEGGGMCIRPTHCVRKSRSCDPYPFVPVLFLERVLYKMVLLVIVAIFPLLSSCFCCLFCLNS